MLVQNCQVLVVEWSRMKHNRSCSMLQHLSKLIFIDFVFQWPFQKPLRTSTSPKNAPHFFRPEFPYNIEFRAANFQTSMVGHLCWRKNMFYLCTFDDSSSTKKETTRKFTFVGWNVNFWGRKVGWKLLEYNTLCSQVFGTKFERTLQDRCPPCFSKKPWAWAEAERNTAQLELKRKTNYDVVCSSVVGCAAQCISREKKTRDANFPRTSWGVGYT